MRLMRVLPVEDEPDHALRIGDLGSESGPVELTRAEEGRAALSPVAQARGRPPDLAPLDIDMPGTGGFETLGRLKNDPATAAIPVVVLITSDVRRDVIRVIAGGADSCACKSVHFAEMEQALAGVIVCWAPR